MKPNPQDKTTLQRSMGLKETITITVGTVIGVGLFTVGANAVGALGPAVLLATLAALAVSIYPALLYAELGAALPYAGGTYQYASLGLGRPFGMLAGWNFIISMIAVASGEAMAFSFYIRTLMETLGLQLPFSDRLIACLAIGFFLFLSIRGNQMSTRIQNGFLFFFWGVTIIWILTMLPALHFENFRPADSLAVSPTALLPAAAMVWWCFAGFETCCAMGEEIRRPQINLPRALFLAPFIVFAVNGLFQWMLLCIVPADGLQSLAAAAAPYADGMRLAGIVGFPLILLCLGITLGGNCSTLNASITASARYLYTMSRDGALPAFLKRLHPKYQTPYRANLLLGILMLLLIAADSITLVASLSLFATLLYYIIGIAAAWRLRRKTPQLRRSYRAPLIQVGAPVSIFLYLVMMAQLDHTAILTGIGWSIVGLLLYLCYSRRHIKAELLPDVPLPPPPSREEQKKLDREYHIWRSVVFAAAGIVLLLYLIAFLTA